MKIGAITVLHLRILLVEPFTICTCLIVENIGTMVAVYHGNISMIVTDLIHPISTKLREVLIPDPLLFNSGDRTPAAAFAFLEG